MQVIINEGLKRFGQAEKEDLTQLRKYVETHRFYHPGMAGLNVAESLSNALKKKHQSGSRGQSDEQQYKKEESLEQLSLYLNKDTNRQIFTLFEYILAHPRGITYQLLSKRLKTDIITISHYCCKLKKLKLIDWDHQKEGVIVFPKERATEREENIRYGLFKSQPNYDLKEGFLFRQLTMFQNIWINISSEDSLSRGGLTNEEIKRKIMKHAENKMVRRTVESMKYFQKLAERQGKVFEFRYKNETEQIKIELSRKNEVVEQIQSLETTILQWLQSKFPQIEREGFLLSLINNKFKDYFSSLGVKQSKRQCTPLKLNRYIKVLNYLHREGGMRESDLRNLIVKDEAQYNIGIMHKRSLMGILEGLKNLYIIYEEEGYYYAGWIQAQHWVKRKQDPIARKSKEQFQDTPRKKMHTQQTIKIQKKSKRKDKLMTDQLQHKYIKISEKQYQLELFLALMVVQIEQALKRIYRKSLNRIVYVERKKNIIKFTPQINVLSFMETPVHDLALSYNHTLQSFYRELDMIVDEKGTKEDHLFEAENEVIKFIRKNPIKNGNFLRIKYGRMWSQKFQTLQSENIVQLGQEGVQLLETQSFLV